MTAETSAAFDESAQPEWQRWLNQFCENWIFAFLIAMAIRHFAVEAFRIPTASMEPMLYGDPGLLKGDHVVVDKLSWRITGTKRWDVTVFQFPRPEVEAGDDGRPAVDHNGNRLDHPLFRPLFCRNFVKRAVVLPGDIFYIANGDLHLKQADGSFAVARKPASTQEALWQDVYIHGDQDGYVPWLASGGAQVDGKGPTLAFDLKGGIADFTQPLRNVYVKPGLVRAALRPITSEKEGELVEVAMTKPVFRVGNREGNLWDLDTWEIQRLTAKDLDAGHGTHLNAVMTEWVGDVRAVVDVTSVTGAVTFRYKQGNLHAYDLELSASGWRVLEDGVELAKGTDAVAGHRWRFGHLDAQVVLDRDGTNLLAKDVPETDPNLHRLRWNLSGTGSLTAGSWTFQRDVHYAARGFLASEAKEKRGYEANVRSGLGENLDLDKNANAAGLIGFVREQMQGRTNLTPQESVDRWGYSPETAITAPAGAYLLLGDNSPFSWDSRMWGFVPAENLRGRALAVMLPPMRWRIVR